MSDADPRRSLDGRQNLYDARSAMDAVFDFHCRHCGYRSEVGIHSEGTGSASENRFGNLGGGVERARDAASYEAWGSARDALPFVACPKCARRNPLALLRWAAWCVTKALLLSVPLIAIGLFVAQPPPGREIVLWPFFVFAGGPPALVAGVGLLWSWLLSRKVARGARFLDP